MPCIYAILHPKNINKIVNMPKINRGKLYNRMLFRNVYEIEIDVRMSREESEESGIKRVCCSCLSNADQWRLKNSTKGMEKQFSLNRMSSENEEFSQSKWNFPLLLRASTRPIKGRFLLCKHRYESALFTNRWNWLPIREICRISFHFNGISNLPNVQSGRNEKYFILSKNFNHF